MSYPAPSSTPTIAVSSGSIYSYGLARFFELAAQAGAEAVEIIVDDRWDTRQPDYMNRLSQEHGPRIVSLHAPFQHVEPMGSDYLECATRTVDLAASVGARVVVIHPEWSRERRLAAAVRRTVLALQPRCQVIMAVENMPFQRLVKQARYPTYTVEGLAQFDLVTLDTSHIGTAEIDLMWAYRSLKERVSHVHLSDFKDGDEHLLPGSGVLPLAEFLQALAADAYSGIVTLELTPSDVGAGDDARVLDSFRRALDFCRQHLRTPALV